MVPPTGASDSVLIRRNGAPIEAYYGAPKPQIKSFPMDNDGEKIKKSWGERWKMGKSGKIQEGQIENANFMVHPDYLYKYGTLSNGVINKSIKCAETWLYGTVGVRGTPAQRPSLFLYPGVVAPSPRIVTNGFVSPAGAFVSVPIPRYACSDRNGFGITITATTKSDSKICQCYESRKDTRKSNSSACKKCGGKRNLGGTLKINKKSRPSLLEATTSPEKLTNPASAPDPYNMMRKNRLGVGESTEPSIFNPENSQRRRRNRSTSPLRGKTRETPNPSFETFKPKQVEEETKSWKNEEENWSNDEDEKIRRKSILECDVNAYDLNRKKNKSKIDDDDDSSDELSDGTLEVNSKLKILRPKLSKTDLIKNRKINIPEPDKLNKSKSEIRLNGQRFKIFDHSNPSTDIVEGYVSDDDDSKNDSMIPRLASPKRPPRKHKEKSIDELAFKYSKLKSKSSPNLSIKSILKKPINEESDAVMMMTTPPESDPISSDTSSETTKQNFNLTRKQSQNNTLKKKKQVQFKVVINSNEDLNDAKGKEEEKEEEVKPAEDETEIRSKSCEDLLLIDDVKSECTTGNVDTTTTTFDDTKCDDRKQLAEEGPRILHTEDNSTAPAHGSTLKRSYSDRRPSSAVVVYKDDVLSLSTSPPNSYLFNDTMALRTRTTRIDTREIFIDENGKVYSDDENPKQNGRLRPKEPPPPPPPPPEDNKLPGNIITYAEFAKLIDESQKEKSCIVSDSIPVIKAPPSPPPRQIFPFVKSRLSDPGFSSTVRVQVPSRNRLSDPGRISKLCDNCENGKTIVTVSSPDKSSVIIQPNNNEIYGKTSVMISNFHHEDKNKVTISVRTEEEPNSSSCTIIETGSNSTVIPVLSTDNKTTLIVGNNSTIVEEPRPQYIFSETEKLLNILDPVEAVRRNLIPHICGKDENGPSSPTLMEKIKLSRDQKNLKQISQLFMNGGGEEHQIYRPAESLLATYQSKKILSQWKNAPNGTFKIEEDSSSSASRSNSFCSTSTSSHKNSSSTNTSRSNSFCSNSHKSRESDYDTNPFLPLSIARSKFYILSDSEEATIEKDKLEDEYEIRNGITNNKKEEFNNEIVENIYETIKEEPIYDQVGIKVDHDESDEDIPPPLPLTLPPSLDEIDQRSPKSIFEGASKYDILSYLVDAKDRVQEDCYFSGSSTSEEIESRRLCSLEESENTSFDSGMHCRTPSDGLEPEESLRRMEGKENDSGVDLISRISHLSHGSDSSEDNLVLAVPERDTLKLNRKSSVEIERNDSGVGSETSQSSRSKWQASCSIREDPQHLCEDCDQVVETQVTDSGVMYAPLVCRKCSKRRSERKEIIQEIVETEEKYGRDLKIILEEFYKPMLVAGLLTPEQLTHIFLNTEELLDNNEQLTDKLRDSLEIAIEHGDEDLLTVNIGKLFLEAGPMLHAFESYCTRQASAAVLLANLEKEKELLRIFLRVSQMENSVLRRMNLNSFLMVPVQRVTKYPLLLARLYKVTPPQHEGRELLKEAQHNIELHLEHMNSEAKDVSATKVWRRFSASTGSGRKTTAELEMINIKLRKMAVDILEWNHEEVRFVLEGKLLYTQPTDNNWKRGRTIKLTPIFVLLVTLGKPNSKYKTDPPEDELTFPTKTGIREATLLLVKEKCGRYTLIREPLFLDKIIVCCETEIDEYFEIQELSTKDTFIFKAEDGERTKEWYRQLQYHAQILGSWRRRRNALANIMINGMMARTYTS